MLEIKFPADNKALALAIGQALTTYASGATVDAQAPSLHSFEKDVVSSIAEAHDTTPAELTKDPKDESQSAPAATQEQPAGGVRVDEKGVAFNGEFCAKAEKPFYASSKREGQWKKRQGVDDSVYDNWYAAELAKVAYSTPAEEKVVDAAAAFSKTPAGPKDFGEFMAWFSEQQAAGNYEACHMEKACQELGLTTLDLVSDPAKVVKLYEYLA